MITKHVYEKMAERSEPLKKKQRLLTSYSYVYTSSSSSHGELSQSELSEASSNLEQQVVTGPQRKFLLSWKSIFPWAETEGEGEGEVVFCRDCRKAGLRDEFALGKIRPPKGWKKEYLRRHALSDNHSKHAIATAKTDSSVFKSKCHTKTCKGEDRYR